jgi:hypothetical protein
MWLHVIYNDRKFTRSVISLFDEAAPAQNIYTVVGDGVVDAPDGTVAVRNATDFIRIVKSRDRWDGVIFNPLAPQCWPWLNEIPRASPVVWYRYGQEAYGSHPRLRRRLYLPETRRAISSRRRLVFAREWIRGIGERLSRRFCPLQRVDFLVGPEVEEWELYRSVGLLSSTAEWAFGCVGSLENVVDCTARDVPCLGPDIRVGHSANPTGNHIDAFRWLSRMDLRGRNVVVPLSYGDDQYRAVVLQKGRQILGDRFMPVMQFMSLGDYNALMNRCGFALMNHLRQQGVGNIMADLWRGGRVFMNSTTGFRAFCRMGLSVELIRDQTEVTFFKPKPVDRILEDRKVLQAYFGRAAVIDATRVLLRRCASLGRTRGG